ncbi:MAG: sensor histidine kinase [Chitinophagales bacterium]
MKNLTPAQIVFRVSLLTFFIILILEAIIFVFDPFNITWLHVAIIPIVFSVITYFIYYFALEKFIYRKIKLIYKTIHQQKSTKQVAEQKIDMRSDLVSEIESDVLRWADDKSTEIESLKKAEQYRREFLGNVSHELKTPMTSLQGYLETLIDGGIDDISINKTYLQKAVKNAERMISIIDDLESIANLENGELKMINIEFDICDLTKDVFDDLEISAKKMQVKLEIKPGCDHQFIVYADKKQIREVLVNLISNSIKYGKEQGKTSVGFYNMGDNILIEVSDNGIGIAKEHLNRVFERFYRIEKSRSRDFGGTGLGLSIVKHIIEAHGQSISVRSSENEGSTFGFTLTKAK